MRRECKKKCGKAGTMKRTEGGGMGQLRVRFEFVICSSSFVEMIKEEIVEMKKGCATIEVEGFECVLN